MRWPLARSADRKEQSEEGDPNGPALPLRNATSHPDRHGQGCPSTLAMQHSGGADLTAALHH